MNDQRKIFKEIFRDEENPLRIIHEPQLNGVYPPHGNVPGTSLSSNYAQSESVDYALSADQLIKRGRFRSALAEIKLGLNINKESLILKAQEAYIRYERNELYAINKNIKEMLPWLVNGCTNYGLRMGVVASIRTLSANLDYNSALDVLADADQVSSRFNCQKTFVILSAERIRLLIIAGMPCKAGGVLRSIPHDFRQDITIQLAIARLAISEGDGDMALQTLHSLIHQLRFIDSRYQLCEALVLAALAEDLLGNQKQSLLALGEALKLACIDGYVRIFIDSDKRIIDLTKTLISDKSFSSVAAIVLARQLTMSTDLPLKRGRECTSPPGLNKRERQILMYLAEGFNNAQVAQRCFLTEGTVKWYLHNLYQKFEVRNRTALLRVIRGRYPIN